MNISPMFFFFFSFPARLNFTEAEFGVAFDTCPPVLLYISVSTTSTLMFSPVLSTWSSPP